VSTPAPTVSITGDPHAANVDGQRFNVVRAGTHEFLRLPRLLPTPAPAQAEPLVQVMGRIESVNGRCELPFVREVLVTGQLLDSVGALRFSTSGSSPDGDGAVLLSVNGSEVGPEEFARRAKSVATVLVPHQPVRGNVGNAIRRRNFLSVQLHLGHAKMSIDWVHRSVPDAKVNHLNFDVSNLRMLSKEFGMDIGGILGRDDHALASTPGPECAVHHTADLHATSSWSHDFHAADLHAASSIAASL
jgi:hypothetical protein